MQIKGGFGRKRWVRLTFLTSKRFLPSAPPSAAPPLDLLVSFFAGAVEPEGASVMSTSAIVFSGCLCRVDLKMEVPVVVG